MGMFLTKEELIEFTGKKQKDKQAQAVANKGLKFDMRDDGSILVLRQAVIALYSDAKEVKRTPKAKPEEPNFNNINA